MSAFSAEWLRTSDALLRAITNLAVESTEPDMIALGRALADEALARGIAEDMATTLAVLWHRLEPAPVVSEVTSVLRDAEGILKRADKRKIAITHHMVLNALFAFSTELASRAAAPARKGNGLGFTSSRLQ